MDTRSRAIRALVTAAVLVTGLAACGGNDTASGVQPPGAPATPKTLALEGGAAVLQRKPPIDALNAYVDGFHFVNGDLQAQVEAHHFCATLNEDVRQCVIFDGNAADAKLVGIEYIVSRRVFEQLPPEERELWHSHAYEVRSGTLVAPGIPAAAEHELMERLVDTYGKTWHTWHPGPDAPLPLGHPLLMAGFTADGQVDPGLVAARDERMDVSTPRNRAARADIEAPAIVADADAWQKGQALQLTLQPIVVKSESPPEKAEPERDAGPPPSTPTRRIRAKRMHQLYAGLPELGDGR